jgi:glycerol-3-phosphate dehydrogenase
MAPNFDVVIIGAGCGGLFTASELADRRVRCLLVDKFPIASFASTRNQGWLQSGAFYAGKGDLEAAAACKRGAELLRGIFPEAIHQEHRGYFLFHESSDQAPFLSHCHSAGIRAEDVSIKEIEGREPLVRGTRFKYAIAVDDRPFDAFAILSDLARRVSAKGVMIQEIRGLDAVTVERSSGTWTVSCDSVVVATSRAIVLTGGAYTARMLDRAGSDKAAVLRTTKIAVMSIDDQMFGSLLAAPMVVQAPNIVPYRSEARVGITICLYRTDREISSPSDFKLDDEDVRLFGKEVSTWYPATLRYLSKRPVRAHVYSCQKIEHRAGRDPEGTPGRAHILIPHGETDGVALDGLFSFYPGKFTAAPVVAPLCADAVVSWLGGTVVSDSNLPPATLEVNVARQPFLEQGAFVSNVNGGLLTFERSDR